MSCSEGFYTMKGYELLEHGEISSAMEDYLEMIARIEKSGEIARVVDLSRLLHVKASSVSKMIRQLADAGLVSAEKYGVIRLTENGSLLGSYLLYRHRVLHSFLCLLNNSNDELEQAEKIEHFLNKKTVRNLELLNIRLAKLDKRQC